MTGGCDRGFIAGYKDLQAIEDALKATSSGEC